MVENNFCIQSTKFKIIFLKLASKFPAYVFTWESNGHCVKSHLVSLWDKPSWVVTTQSFLNIEIIYFFIKKNPSLLSNIFVSWYLVSHFNSRFLYRMPFWLFLSLLMSDFFAPGVRGEISSCITIFCAIHSVYYRRFKSTKILHSRLQNQVCFAFKLHHTLFPL